MTAERASAVGQTLLGFDYGARRIGVAVGNTLTGTARPLSTVAEPVAQRRFERIGGLLREWMPDALVVGRPLHPDGSAHAVTAAAERFARQLHGRFRLPVALVDERYSTVEAQARAGTGRASRGGESDDALAAAVILEQYLDEAALRRHPPQEARR
ncbi:MAG: Holliday junction resolvase RuvX [Lautropia sp.]